jgi:hypothetical protein
VSQREAEPRGSPHSDLRDYKFGTKFEDFDAEWNTQMIDLFVCNLFLSKTPSTLYSFDGLHPPFNDLTNRRHIYVLYNTSGSDSDRGLDINIYIYEGASFKAKIGGRINSSATNYPVEPVFWGSGSGSGPVRQCGSAHRA